MFIRLSEKCRCHYWISVMLFAMANPVYAFDSTITIEGKNSKGEHINLTLTRAQLERLPQSTLTTHLPWIKGKAKFLGIKLSTLLETYHLQPHTIKLRALNDYSTEVSWQEVKEYEPVIALRKNNRYLKVRDYGPFWLIFSIDAYPELAQTKYLAKMIWQLEKIRVE